MCSFFTLTVIAVGSLSLANGRVRKIEKRATKREVDSVVGLYIGVVQQEKRKEGVFLDVFTRATGVF